MRLAVIQRITGLLLMMFSVTMLPPTAISMYFNDGSTYAFLGGFGLTALTGFLVWLPVRKRIEELRLRDGFLIVAAFWLGLGFCGAIPLLLLEAPSLSITDAFFESMSGLTTTGATVLTGLDDMPKSLLYYRQQLQWFGGMGIIVLAVAVLPMLGVGGMQLYRAEIAGPVKDSKLTPRITETAQALWVIYVGLTVACGLAYWYAGMGMFDALCHAFSTVAIGGFSTHDASLAWFDNRNINMIAMLFMFISGVNFSLHFLAWRGKTLKAYITDSEFISYTRNLVILCLAIVGGLYLQGEYDTLAETIDKGPFQVISIATTTGFTTADFSVWPGAIPAALIFASFIGGCAGSTGGGMKVMRCMLLYRQGVREIKRLVHPNAEIPVKLGGKTVPPRVIESVWGFFAVYVVVFIIMLVLLMADGMDQITAFSAVAASLNNLGPGLGEVAANYAGLSDLAKWVCVAAMLLGRLEIFTLLVLVSRTFWQP